MHYIALLFLLFHAYILVFSMTSLISSTDVSDTQEQDPLADATYIRANFTYIPRTPKELEIKTGDVFHIHDEVNITYIHTQLVWFGGDKWQYIRIWNLPHERQIQTAMLHCTCTCIYT